jgi:hypothetical protein
MENLRVPDKVNAEPRNPWRVSRPDQVKVVYKVNAAPPSPSLLFWSSPKPEMNIGGQLQNDSTLKPTGSLIGRNKHLVEAEPEKSTKT